MSYKKNNKLIAEFMELKQVNNVRDENGKYYNYHASEKFGCIKEQQIQIESENGFGLVEQDYLFNEDLKFHDSWNWLMPVVKKCFDCSGITNPFRLEIIKSMNGVIDIMDTYRTVTDFILWYNDSN